MPSIVPDAQFVTTKRDAGSQILTNLISKDAIPNLTGTMYGLHPPDVHILNLGEHAVPTTEFPGDHITHLVEYSREAAPVGGIQNAV